MKAIRDYWKRIMDMHSNPSPNDEGVDAVWDEVCSLLNGYLDAYVDLGIISLDESNDIFIKLVQEEPYD